MVSSTGKVMVCNVQEDIVLMEVGKVREVSHPEIKTAFEAYEDGGYVPRPPLQEKYRQSLQKSPYSPEECTE